MSQWLVLPAYSPQTAFLFALLEVILSSLAAAFLLWLRWREPSSRRSRATTALAVSFVLFALGFGGKALLHLFTLAPGHSESMELFLVIASDVTRIAAAAFLMSGWLIRSGRIRLNRPKVIVPTAVVPAVVACLLLAPETHLTILPVTPALSWEIALWAVGLALLYRALGAREIAPLVALGLARSLSIAAFWRPEATEPLWALEHLMTLLGLSLVLLDLERETRENSVRFFLRINVTFVVLASTFVLTVTEIARRQFVEMAALRSTDLAEYVRGYAVIRAASGTAPEQVLLDDALMRGLVEEFGRYPDLRRLELSLGSDSMALDILESGTIERHIWQGHREVAAAVMPTDFLVARVLSLPIVWEGRRIGTVHLDHSLNEINVRIGDQTQLVFAVLTVFVGLTMVATGMLVIKSDQTIRRQFQELERTRRRLSLAERLASIGAVVSDVAHEINNPAGILVARVDYLRSVLKDKPLDTEIKDDLETVYRQASRIGKTVRDVLDLTRSQQMKTEPVDLVGVVSSAVALVKPIAQNRCMELHAPNSTERLTILGDADRLEQVFTNLLTNAIQATNDHGRITVSFEPRLDGWIDVAVSDDGCGIDPDTMDRIFDPFFSTKRPGSGTGLGLTIAYSIIRDHGGWIEVNSIRGGGAEFLVTLPPATGPSS